MQHISTSTSSPISTATVARHPHGTLRFFGLRRLALAATIAVAGTLGVGTSVLAASHAATGHATIAVTDRLEVDRWSDSIWAAAKVGDLAAVEAALKNVPESHAAAQSKQLRELVAIRAQHVDDGAKTRDADRQKAIDSLKENFGKGEITKALTDAVRLQTLSDNWAEALKLPEIVELVKSAEAAEIAAAEQGDWLVSQEILFRLRTLFEESGDAAAFRRYDAMLDTVNKRIVLLAQYAPRELWRLRQAYATRVEPEKEFPPFNEAFADDWKEALEGISKGMLTSALTTAANDHISSGGWEPLVSGGLEAIRVLATTSALKENFAGLGDDAKAKALLDAVVKAEESLARMNRDQVGRPQYNAALRDVLSANAQGPKLPDAVIYREFGDGAIEELSKRFEDEYTQIIWPDQLRRFEQMIKGNFVGVGIMIRHDDRRDIQVISPLEGSPASRFGVKSDDRIVAVDGKSTVGWTLNKAVDAITGPSGQNVKLTVKREGVSEPIELTLVREEIKIRSVNGWWKKALDEKGVPQWDWYVAPESGIGYVRLSSFNDDSFADFLSAVREMRRERDLRGLVLDLRHNPGGLLKSAVDFSNAFVERGRVVAGQDRNGRQVWQMSADPGRSVLKDLPVVVLVNQGSASASEIVAGALRAHDAAVVIGERTFGKGSVQTVHPCGDQRADAQLKLTTQYYVIPPGAGETEQRLVHKRPGASDWGVNPDLLVKMMPAQIEKVYNLRQSADVIEEWKDVAEQKERPNVQELLVSGIDPQLELAVLVLKARALKEFDAAAQANAAAVGGGDAKGG
jgi:carboxyl-terminal processing protease